MYGFNIYYNESHKCNSQNGTKMEGIKPFDKKDTVYMMVHKGSYSNFEKTSAKVSFFLKKPKEKDPLYHFTFINIPLLPGEKLHGYINTFKQKIHVKIGKPLDNYNLPNEL